MNRGKNKIVLYKTEDGRINLDVHLHQETIWLNLNQMAKLFERDKSVISRHLHNVYNTNELRRGSTVAFFATVQNEKGRSVERKVEFFNLDAIISVGYRVNSRRGTQFRIWATRVLSEHIIKGYTLNEKRLKEENARLIELERTVELMGRVIEERELASDEADGHDAYLSAEEKAAHLLYLVVKDHGFVDGNKRIGAALFVWFLHANGLLYLSDGRRRLADNALVALTLLIAESRPSDKDVLIKVVVNLINRKNQP
jgi:prophage maintenance system killer protein